MVKITYIEHGGTEHVVDVAEGLTVMEGARDNNIPGIDADCGGACACGTCHCFIEENWQEAIGTSDAMEESMLGMRPDRSDSSRLSCQIDVSEAMEGMVVRLPEFQM